MEDSATDTSDRTSFSSEPGTEAETSAVNHDSNTIIAESTTVTISESTTIDVLELFSSSAERANGTDFALETVEGDALRDWQVILIASLSAGGIIIIAVFLILWKFCHRKPNVTNVQTRNVTPGPASSSTNGNEGRSKKGCCSCFPVSANRKSSSIAPRETAQSSQGQHSIEKEGLPGQQLPISLMDTRPPLPPIGDENRLTGQLSMLNDPLAVGRAHMMPRRLAPLTTSGKITATNLAGGTVVHRTGAFGPVQQHTELRGIPSLPVPLDQRRSLPPPPAD